MLTEREHSAIRELRGFAEGANRSSCSERTLRTVAGVCGSVFMTVKRPVRADVVAAITRLCGDLVRSDRAPAGFRSVSAGLGVPLMGREDLVRLLEALCDDLETGAPYVDPALATMCAAALDAALATRGFAASHAGLFGRGARGDLDAAMRRNSRGLARCATWAVFAGRFGRVDVPNARPPGDFSLTSGAWTLSATFEPHMKVVMTGEGGRMKFYAHGAAVSSLMALFLAESYSRTVGGGALSLTYPSEAAAGALCWPNGSLLLTTRRFGAMQDLVRGYFEDERRRRWADEVANLFGDV